MQIGALARRTGCPVQTIRYYEREGLLPAPARSEGNYRVYAPAEVERLTFIRNCRVLGMTLEEIRRLLGLRDGAGQNCSDVTALVDAHIEHVSVRIASLQGLQEELLRLRHRCRGPETAACETLQQLNASGGVQAGGDGHSHVAAVHR